MSILIVRSIPLSKDTRDAWNSAGGIIASRRHDVVGLRNLMARNKIRGILNLGNLQLDLGKLRVPVFNPPESIRAVSHPSAVSKTLAEFVPPNDTSGPHWHKRGGFGGDGVQLCRTQKCNAAGVVQAHVEGVEYRVITVGNAVVQASRKTNIRWVNGKHHFNWDWVGVEGIRKTGIIPHIKAAIEHVPSWEHTMFGWDIIVGNSGGVYTLEVNTSPGVNVPTAERIVRAITERL